MSDAMEKSDLPEVARKRANKAASAAARGAKGRGQGECGQAKHGPDAAGKPCQRGRRGVILVPTATFGLARVFTSAVLVGAAMCSAFERGTSGRWP
jgi:hypothetical protein